MDKLYIHRSRGLTAQAGFTLIELLVVIAIIGILSSVVLASLNTARNKGNDASIQSNLSAVRVQAEIFYSDTVNTYGIASTDCLSIVANVLWASPIIKKAIQATDVANGASGGMLCQSTGTGYAVQSRMVHDPNTFWCVDSAGQAIKMSTSLIVTQQGAPECK